MIRVRQDVKVTAALPFIARKDPLYNRGQWECRCGHTCVQEYRGSMANEDPGLKDRQVIQRGTHTRKPYEKPAFRFERVFETSALTCGKTDPLSDMCKHNRKVS